MVTRTRECSGMTLLELVVAIAISSLVAAAAYAALTQGLVIYDRLQAERRFWQRFESVFNLVRSDLLQAVERAPRSTTSAKRAFSGNEHAGAGEYGQLLEFTRRAHTAYHEGQASPYQRVAYRIYQGGLYRMSWPHLDSPYGTDPVETLLLDSIGDIHLRYLTATDGWSTRWPRTVIPGPGYLPDLPGAVELTVNLIDRGPYRWLFHVGPPD